MDLTGLDTGNVTNMYQMFSYCNSLTSLDLSRFNTGNVTDMSYMFSGCSGLTNLDLSSFNTAKVTSMGDMFYNCNKISSVILGQNFSFKGNGSTSCVLSAPPSASDSAYTGKWIKEDKAAGPYSPEGLRDNY